MKVMLITAKYPPQQCGIGDHTYKLASRLSHLGHRVSVLCSVLDTTEDEVSGSHSSVETIREVSSWDFRKVQHILNVVQDRAVDVLHIQYHTTSFDQHPMMTLLPFLVKYRSSGLKTKVKVVVTMHEFAGPITAILPRQARRLWLLPLMYFSDAVIITNERDMGYLRWMPYIKRKLHYIPFASNIDPKGAKNRDVQAMRRRMGVSEEEVLVARFGFVDNVHVSLLPELLHAVKKLVETGYRVKLLLIGGESTEGRAEIVSLARVLGIAERVLMTGYCSESDVSAYLSSADIGAQPYPEGVCERRTGLQAAMAHGLPIVCTKKRHIPSMFVHRENVLLVPVGDVRCMAEAIESLIRDRDLRHKLNRNVLKTAEKFNWKMNGNTTETLYRSLLYDSFELAVAASAKDKGP